MVDHSLEVEARIGPVKIETLFGVLRIELDSAIPETLAIASIGKPVGDVVDHPALRGQPWSITGIEVAPSPSLGQTLVVETGSLAFRMPWLRADASVPQQSLTVPGIGDAHGLPQ